MSVTSAMMSGVSGLLTNAEAINVIGNNISNVNTVGFKYGRTLFSDLLSNSVNSTSQIGMGTQLQAVENIFSQGAAIPSENATDISISGRGFFVVQDDSATPSTYYTRAGAFHVDENGKYLVNPDGMRLCDSAGALIDVSGFPVTAAVAAVAAVPAVAANPTAVPPVVAVAAVPAVPAIPAATFDKITNIGLDGVISYIDTAGTTRIAGAVVGIATFPNEFGLEKTGGNMYKEDLSSGGSGAVKLGTSTVNTKIVGRSLEQSNVDIAAQMINLITTQRAYSANSKSITTSDEMMQDVIGLKR